MYKSIINKKMIMVGCLIILAALLRILPHYPNFTPIAAIALFGGAYISHRWAAFLIPVLALLISDLFLGFHPFMLAVYGSFVLVVVVGRILKRKVSVLNLVGASLLSSSIFFIITNFAVWAAGPYYAKTVPGLLQCYINAIPFYHVSVLGDLFYTGVLFGSFYFAYARHLQKSSNELHS